VLSHRGIALPFTKLQEAKTVEFFRVRVYFSIGVNSTERKRYERSRRDGHAVGEREGANGKARYAHFASRNQLSTLMDRPWEVTNISLERRLVEFPE